MAQSTCAHYEQLPYAKVTEDEASTHQLILKLKKVIEQEKGCQACGKSVASSYICLNPECLYVGCGREDKKHALEHYRSKHRTTEGQLHSVALSTRAHQCWCYACDDLIVPPIIAALGCDGDDGAVEGREDGQEGRPGQQALLRSRKGTRSVVSQPPIGVIGLFNLGNSCYMNAAIQALLNCPSLLGFFRNCDGFILRSNNRRISESFNNLVETIMTLKLYTQSFARTRWLICRNVVSPSRLVREVKLANPMFHGYSQQDTMDFVRCILDRLHEELKYSIEPAREDGLSSSNSSSPQRRKSERLSKQASNSGRSPLRAKGSSDLYSSIVSETFGGMLRSEIDCLVCRNVSTKDDPFFDLGVQISAGAENTRPSKSSLGYIGSLFSSITESMGINGKPVRLESCLAAFCAPEKLEGKDRYRCEKCNDLVPSQKTLKIKELPQILCIQLKRFRHDSYFSSKLNTPVSFPIDILDMRPYLHEAASPQSKQESRYYLLAVISHRGTFSGGHYVAYCRHQPSGQWLEFDDSNVSVVSDDDVRKVQAYALFYALVDWNIRRERDEWLPRITEAEINKDPRCLYVSRQWFSRWCTMANPGPLNNRELACEHGALRPERTLDPARLVQILPQSAYDYFRERYGESSGEAPLATTTPCQICEEEMRQLDLRRKREEKDILALDTSSLKEGSYWYLISADWLVRWGQFKSGAAQPPGPISNDLLIGPDGNPRTNLVRGIHYRGINGCVWDYFMNVYGGGPAIVRKSINIYSPAPSTLPNPERSASPIRRSTRSTPADDCDVFVDVEGH